MVQFAHALEPEVNGFTGTLYTLAGFTGTPYEDLRGHHTRCHTPPANRVTCESAARELQPRTTSPTSHVWIGCRRVGTGGVQS